jgi:Flp pilus assembly protein TadB
MEVMHITSSAAAGESVGEEDRAYLTNLVAAKTGISMDDAQKRVDRYLETAKEAAMKAKAAADQERKAAASASIYTALSMLVGAFIASVAAALGGRLRDEHS